MSDSRKRSAGDGPTSQGDKRQKLSKAKKWRAFADPTRHITPGDTGILATCVRGKERKAEDELLSLLDHYVKELYPATAPNEAPTNGDESDADIEADIRRELNEMKAPDDRELLQAIRMEMECVIFIKTKPPIEPTTLVYRVCKDAHDNLHPQSTRFVMRLTPVALIGKASEQDMERVGRLVLAPHFGPSEVKKFAIRPTIRNHTQLKRDEVIQRVAQMVGPGHKVDLKQYDLLILVDVWHHLCGMAVVGADYEDLKRYNLAELHGAASGPA